jgi:hypothetical protein
MMSKIRNRGKWGPLVQEDWVQVYRGWNILVLWARTGPMGQGRKPVKGGVGEKVGGSACRPECHTSKWDCILENRGSWKVLRRGWHNKGSPERSLWWGVA